MGSGRFDSKVWRVYAASASYDTKSAAEIFTASSISEDLDPKNIKGVMGVRESRDSTDNPESTAIIVAQDVTGSMHIISEVMAKKGVPTLLEEIYARRPVTDPHVMCMAIGDVECDSAPLQVTQFEADMRIAKQLELFFLEAGGGGNSYESYALAWWFAAFRTSTDCFDKRGKKGYLFTIGDEEPTARLTRDAIARFIDGEAPLKDVDMAELLEEVSRRWEIFHVIVEEGNYARTHRDRVKQAWTSLIGQRALPLSDHTKLAEVIVSAIQVAEGARPDDVADSWDGDTSLVVRAAVGSLLPSASSGSSSSGLVAL